MTAMDIADIRAARERIAGQVAVTPVAHSVTLSRLTGAEVSLKFENLQFTSSFKERGALNCLLCLTEAERARGVIAMSAGNHAQALAYHGQRLGVPTTIVMPRFTPNAKVAQTRVFQAEVILHGNVFDEARQFTFDLAAERDLTLVHPYDDPRVIAGQGTLGLELLEQCPDMDVVVVPVGGGGLIGGVSSAVKALRPEVRVVGVQVERFAAAYNAYHRLPDAPGAPGTVAEGIAVKSPGANTLPLIERHVDDMLLVSEEQVEQAIFSLTEIEKTVVEGAGAASLAALYAHRRVFEGQRVVLILSGGNIDMMMLSSVLQRGMVRTRRLVRLKVEIPDVPGALADITRVLAELDSNIMEIEHQRAFAGSSVRSTVVELVLQMRGEEQVDQVLAALSAQGYEASLPS
jgi:threonine dehydratase|tara:strand:- start:942 stop:2153 length:1212 start_codon:yes stop_codon:yes gene_type:complete